MSKTNRIITLETLRAFAFIGVMVSHSGISVLNGFGGLSVSIFLILCGFVSVYSQYEKKITPSLTNNIKYAFNKIRKLYPLHVFMTILALVFCFVGDEVEPLFNILIKLILNLLLVQEWFPINGRSINGVSWYLCVMILFYFVFPYFLSRMKQSYSVSKAKRNICVLFIFQIIIGIIGYLIATIEVKNDFSIVRNTTQWIIYYHPISRLVDMVIGCNLGYIFLQNKVKQVKKATIKEAVTILFAIFDVIIYALLVYRCEYYAYGASLTGKEMWWSYVLLFTPISMLLVYLFACGQGKITHFLSNKFILYFAKISSTGFLIHQNIFHYIDAVIILIYGNEGRIFTQKYSVFLKLSLGIVLTIICCEIWNKYFSKKIDMNADNN